MKIVHSFIILWVPLIFCCTSPLYVREVTTDEVRIGQKIRIIDVNGNENKFKVERISKEKIFGSNVSVKKENIQKIEIMVGGEEDFGILEHVVDVGIVYDAVQ